MDKFRHVPTSTLSDSQIRVLVGAHCGWFDRALAARGYDGAQLRRLHRGEGLTAWALLTDDMQECLQRECYDEDKPRCVVLPWKDGERRVVRYGVGSDRRLWQRRGRFYHEARCICECDGRYSLSFEWLGPARESSVANVVREHGVRVLLELWGEGSAAEWQSWIETLPR